MIWSEHSIRKTILNAFTSFFFRRVIKITEKKANRKYYAFEKNGRNFLLDAISLVKLKYLRWQ